jgi:hypothetical protein
VISTLRGSGWVLVELGSASELLGVGGLVGFVAESNRG